jgi:integrase
MSFRTRAAFNILCQNSASSLRLGIGLNWTVFAMQAGPPTEWMTMASLNSLIGDAQERGLVARNVVRDLRSRRKKGLANWRPASTSRRLPKSRLYRGHRRPLAAVFSRGNIPTGLRSSELRGLRWADIDLKKADLHVRQRADRYNKIGAPKSEAGARTVPSPPGSVRRPSPVSDRIQSRMSLRNMPNPAAVGWRKASSRTAHRLPDSRRSRRCRIDPCWRSPPRHGTPTRSS